MVPAPAQTYFWAMLIAMAALARLLLSRGSSDGPAGTAVKALHLAQCTRLLGGGILHPLQHRLLSSDCQGLLPSAFVLSSGSKGFCHVGSQRANATSLLFCGSCQAPTGPDSLSAEPENKPEGLLQIVK